MNRFLLATVLLAAACGAPTPQDSDDDVIVSEGKEDNFYSANAVEYFASGKSTVTIEDDYAGKSASARLARARQLVQLKNVQIGWFLNVYLTEKEEDDANSKYGGFGGLVRFASEDDSAPVTTDGKTYTFDYKVQVAGGRTLASKVGSKFTLKMGKLDNATLAQLDYNHEWYRNEPWSSFDPSKLSADQIETIDLSFTRQAASKDAWLAYDRLFADGEVTIAVHFGWDYWDRYDIQGARNLYNFLVGEGFKPPVAKFEEMQRDSGPLEKTVTSNGKPVVVKIWIFHPGNAAANIPGPDPDTDEGGDQLEADMRDSFAHREVIVFEGHSGPLYGFALADWKKTEHGDVDDSKIPSLDMPSTYQIVLANGCDTYDLGSAFWKNPAKADRQSLNVITTTSYSNAATEASAQRLMKAFYNQTRDKVVPVKVSELTAGLDADQGYGFNALYGVHGVDANPKYDPFSDASKLCQRCSADADCGADGNRCTKLSSTRKACTVGCTDDSGCPTGYACRAVASATSRTVKTRQCVPTTLSCR